MMTWWRRVRAALLGAMILTTIPVGVRAVPPSPEVLERLRTEGKLEDFKRLDASARRRGVNQPDPYRLAAEGTAAVTGNLGALVIIVEFSDNLAAGGGSYLDSTYFNDMLFSSNTPGYSMNDHYQEMSYGMVTISGQTVGWLTMPQTYAYYVDGQRGFGSYPRNAQKLAEDAVDAAEAAGVDFSQYDNDNDGNIDGLFIVHAGRGYENTGDLNMIHSHQWVLGSARNYDGVNIWEYTMEPEENGSGQPIEVGVFSHEFGHFIGLPDLYDTDYSSAGLGLWCLMASGSYAGGSDYPAHMNVWCKMVLGWVNPTNITLNTVAAEIPQIETEPVAYRIWAGGALGNEYFLVENRQKVGFDAYLRGPGLCIYHIDDNKWGSYDNTQEWYPGLSGSQHFLVAMEQADGGYDLERDYNGGDSSDPWPGATGKRAFDDFSSPNSKAYSGMATQIAIWDISNSDSLMTANLDIWFSQPHFDFVSTGFTDDGNGDGRPDPGENVSLVMAQRNGGSAVLDAEFMVTTDDSSLTFSDSTAYVGPVSTGATGNNASDPFTFSVPVDYEPRIADFYLTVTADGGAYQKTDTVSVNVGPDQILVVDDDAQLQPYASYDVIYFNPVLDSLRVPYATWDVKASGTPTTLDDYPMVLWFTGNRRIDPVAGPDTTLTPSERTAIAAYLDSGGSLFLTGQQIAYMLDIADSAFMHDYLHAVYGGPAYDFVAEGIPGDVVGDQTKYVQGGGGGAGNQLVKDLLLTVNGAVPAFEEDNNPGNVNGVRYDGGHKVLFLGWGVEGIGDDIAYQFDAQPKSVLIERAIDWMLHNAVFSGVTLQPLVVNPGQDPTRLVDTAIDLYWNFEHPQGALQDSVEVQVGSDADWSVPEYWSYGPVTGGDTTVHYGGPTVQVGNTYYWRVRVYAGGTWSDWSSATWHMNAGPPAPLPSSPLGDAIAFQNGPELRTNSAIDPEGDACLYDFEVYADSVLTSLLASAVGVPQGGSTTSWTVDVQLPEQNRAWWRVRASDGYFTSPWSGAASFYTDGINEPPTAPALVLPLDAAVLFSTDLSLQWGAATDPDLIETLLYRVRVDTQASLATATVYDSLESQLLNVAGVLEPAHTYYWDVTVFDKGGLEASSPVWLFRNLLAGDVSGDGSVTASDVIFMVNYVFKGGPAPDPVALGDVNADCTVGSSDIIYEVNYVFKGSIAPQIGCAVAVNDSPPEQTRD